MDFEKAWNEALKHTEIVRSRISALHVGSDTRVPYVLLCESSINLGDTVVREGTVLVKKPGLILPPNNPQFYGFELDNNEDTASPQDMDSSGFMNFLIVRGIQVPSLRYDNSTTSLTVFEGSLSKAVDHYNKQFQQTENVSTGLVVGSEDYWQFSLLIFICAQITRNLDVDIRKLLEEYQRRQGGG